MGRFSQWLRRVMAGRYGTDKLNTVILVCGVVLAIVCIFLPWPTGKLVLTVLSYGLMFWAIFRAFSRNTYKRYRENQKFFQFFGRLKDRKHKYFDCPHCRQNVRVPKGKGKISITCPRCKNKFIKKT